MNDNFETYSNTTMSLDYQNYEDQDTDETSYGHCTKCGKLDELGRENLCYVCESKYDKGALTTDDFRP